MKKKMTSLLALFCMMFCAGASAQSAYQKAYDKAKSKSLVNALSFSLEKDKERLRKAAYKYREDIPKEVLKMAKKDNAILHGTWIQGQTKSWDLFGKPLPIPEAYVPLCRYNDSVFAIRNTMMEAQFVQLYNTKKKGLVCILANSLDEIVYQPFLNSVLSNFKAPYGYSNELTTLDGKYSFTKSDNKPLISLQVVDFCRKDSANAKSTEYADYMDRWKLYYYKSKVSDDRELYKDNVWVQNAERYYALGEYRKALFCIEQFMAFDIDGMNDRNGMFAYELKYMQLKCYRELKKYNDVLAAMDYLKRADYLADGMYFSPQSKSIVVCAGVSEDVETNFKSKMLTLCKECQTCRKSANATIQFLQQLSWVHWAPRFPTSLAAATSLLVRPIRAVEVQPRRQVRQRLAVLLLPRPLPGVLHAMAKAYASLAKTIRAKPLPTPRIVLRVKSAVEKSPVNTVVALDLRNSDLSDFSDFSFF